MIRRTRSEWLLLIKDQKNSNLTATEFCKIKGIDSKYFSLKKAKLRSLEVNGSTDATAAEWEIEVTNAKGQSKTIHYP